MIVWTGVLSLLGANKCQMLDTRDVGWMRAMQKAIRVSLLVQPDEVASTEHGFDERGILRFATRAPLNAIGLRKAGGFFNPLLKRAISRSHQLKSSEIGSSPALPQMARVGSIAMLNIPVAKTAARMHTVHRWVRAA
jgi:hypothetical protein